MRRWIGGLIGAFGVALIGLVLDLTPLGVNIEQSLGLRWLFLMRGPISPPSNVAVVAIDDQTGGRLELSKLPREWPRSVHGLLVDALVHHGVSAIVFDFDFQSPKRPEDDNLFAKSIAAADRVVLTEKLIGKRQPLFGADGSMKGALWVEQLVAPIPILADAAKGAGTFPLPKVDVAVHEFWVFKRSVDYAPTTPTMALQIHAQQEYPRLVELLQKAGVSGASALSRIIKKSDRTPEIRGMMSELHRIFSDTPEIDIKLREALNESRKDKQTEGDPQLLDALIGLYAGSDHRYLNFYGPPGTITTVPYHKVIEESKGASGQKIPDLKDKVVFVGYSDLYDPSQPDRFYTVYTNNDGVDLSGVEIAATAYANLLTNRSLSPADPARTIATLSVFGGVIGGITQILPAIASVPLTLILAGAYLYFSELAFSGSNLWLPLAVPLLIQLPLALFSGLLTQYLSERRKKKRATNAISYYLPEKLARDFTEKNLESSALNKVTYSVCFASDMAGFTTISEQLPPKELAIFLNDYFEALSFPLKKYGVDVIEFRADGIMCAWTADRPETGIHKKAMLAGLEAIEAIDRFKKRYAQLSQSLRIGIEVGMAYVGHAGGGGHFVFSIVGDCANTAARIEGLNKHLNTQLLASGFAMEGVDGVLSRFLGEFRFVGKTDALPIIEVLALESSAIESQKQLCERFAVAMDMLRLGHWSEAGDVFENILQDYPEDGPSRYHLARCQRHANTQSNESPWIIHMDSK